MYGLAETPFNPLDDAIQTAKDRVSLAGWFAAALGLGVMYLVFRPGRR